MGNYYCVLKQTNKIWTEIYRTDYLEIAKKEARYEYMKERKNRIIVEEYHPYYTEDEEYIDEDWIATVWDSDDIAPWED